MVSMRGQAHQVVRLQSMESMSSIIMLGSSTTVPADAMMLVHVMPSRISYSTDHLRRAAPYIASRKVIEPDAAEADLRR